MIEEIDKISFSLSSEDDIIKSAVCEIDSLKLSGPGSVYDLKMGSLEENVLCHTCRESSTDCPGHFGKITLNSRVCSPLFYKTILSILKSICYRCSKLLISKERLELQNNLKKKKSSRFNMIVKSVEKIDFCSHCQNVVPKFVCIEKGFYLYYKSKVCSDKIAISADEIYKIFLNISEEDKTLLGFEGKSKPCDLILSILPVLPPTSRPYVKTDGLTCDDDLTLQYIEIIKTNNMLKKYNMNELKREKLIQTLNFRIRSLFDNSNEKQKVSNGGRPIRGFKKRICGKEGLIRLNLMGKRVNFSGRSVIGGDPTLNVDEIGVPEDIAKNLSYTETISQYNFERIQSDLENGLINYVIKKDSNGKENRINTIYATKKLQVDIQFGDVIFRNRKYFKTIQKEKDKFELIENDTIFRNGEKIILENSNFVIKKKFNISVGDVVERHLKDGDFLFLNRQPTLHCGSMMGMKIKILKGKTIRLNLAVTQTYNADFDGDEMNLHSPSTLDSDNELKRLSSIDNFIINPQNSQANIVLVQDTILALYRMTLKKHQNNIPKHKFFHMIGSIQNFDLEFFEKKKYTFLKKLNLKDENNIYVGKFLFSFLLPEDFFYLKENNVDEDDPTLIIENGILLKGSLNKKDVNKILQLIYLEYDAKRCKQFINDATFISMEYLYHCGFSVGIEDCLTYNKEEIQNGVSKALIKAESISNNNIRNHKIQEIYTRVALLEARDLGLKLSKDNININNNFLYCLRSGSKGALFNLLQITSLLGQQEVSGNRISYCINNNTRVLPHFPLNKNYIKDYMEKKQKGFIQSSFLDGLDVVEFYTHSMTGREGVLNTSMKTSSSGYVQRRMCKLLEDYIIQYDGTVRKQDNTIVQFVYGKSHLNPSESFVINGDLKIVDIDRLIKKIRSNSNCG